MKKFTAFLVAATMVLTNTLTVMAGEWQTSEAGWRYKNDDGSYAFGGWAWIDGNNDGTSESYCFDENGILYMNTTTPDGYSVNQDGAWTIDGVVQTQAKAPAQGGTSGEGEYVTLEVGYNARIPAGMEREHDYILDYYRKTMAHFQDAEGTRFIGFEIDDYREQAEYFQKVEGTTDASLQESDADAVGTILKAAVVARDTREYHSGTWSHVQLADYVGDYDKHWKNVHYFFRSKDFVVSSVRIMDTGVEIDIDGFMNSLGENDYYARYWQ